MIEPVYNFFLFWPPYKQILLLGTSSDYIVKTIKPLHNVLKASTNQFANYHPHYKDKFSNRIWSFVFIANNIYSLCNLCNFSTAFTCAAESSLVIKKENY